MFDTRTLMDIMLTILECPISKVPHHPHTAVNNHPHSSATLYGVLRRVMLSPHIQNCAPSCRAVLTPTPTLTRVHVLQGGCGFENTQEGGKYALDTLVYEVSTERERER